MSLPSTLPGQSSLFVASFLCLLLVNKNIAGHRSHEDFTAAATVVLSAGVLKREFAEWKKRKEPLVAHFIREKFAAFPQKILFHIGTVAMLQCFSVFIRFQFIVRLRKPI